MYTITFKENIKDGNGNYVGHVTLNGECDVTLFADGAVISNSDKDKAAYCFVPYSNLSGIVYTKARNEIIN